MTNQPQVWNSPENYYGAKLQAKIEGNLETERRELILNYDNTGWLYLSIPEARSLAEFILNNTTNKES